MVGNVLRPIGADIGGEGRRRRPALDGEDPGDALPEPVPGELVDEVRRDEFDGTGGAALNAPAPIACAVASSLTP